MTRNFNEWFKNLKTSISNYDYYTDFKKAFKNVDKLKFEIDVLNSLIGSNDIEKDFKRIIEKYPSVLKCIPLLLAVHSNEIFIKDDMIEHLFSFEKRNYPIDDYVDFMDKTHLFDLFYNNRISDFYPYFLGIEVGLDSNGRKNRGGYLMENLVEKYIQKAGYKENVTYFKQITIKDIENKWNVNLSKMSGNKVSSKRFDFVIKTDKQIYLIETNFYASSGSKLNETARSYKMLAQESDRINGVTFVWITDGLGWAKAKNNLEETFNELENLYNINDLGNDILNDLK